MADKAVPLSPYVVLARKWRSAQFSDLVGQSHVVRTLVNALKLGRLHQAYLFTGSRGIGKTSIARIFAKTLRCPNAKAVAETFQSCDDCSDCREIAAGTSVDVIEIDGASNNGVDAVREIRDNAKFLPSSGSRKIYIIDEVHMLTTAAFNALLKTLEEPPPHVLFVFATTEPHKIPATVLSRVQRFDFRKASVVQIQSHLEKILAAEGVSWEPAALPLIARSAEGSMRDALSLLDQVIAYGGAFNGQKLTTASVRESVGMVTSQTVLTLLEGIFLRNPERALECVQRAFEEGHDLRVLNRSIIEFLHATILAKIGSPHLHSAELTEEEWKEIRRISVDRELEELDLFFQVFHHGYETLARSPQPKLALDVLIIKCASAQTLVSIDQVAAAPAHAPPGSTAPAPLKTSVTPEKSTVLKADTPPRSWESFIESVRNQRPLLAALLENASCPEIPPPPAAGQPSPTFVISLRPEDSYYKEQLQNRTYHEQLGSLAREYFGHPLRFVIELRAAGDGTAHESIAARKERERKEREAVLRTQAQSHPMIREAQALFGGELGPIEILGNDSTERGGDARP